MDPSQPYFPITHKEKKKSKKKDSNAGCFCKFCRNFKNTFFKNISSGCFWRWTRQNQTTAHYIPIERMLSLNDCLWIILTTGQNGHVVTFFCSRPKVKMGQNQTENLILYSFKKGNCSLKGRAISPNVLPQLHHWYFTELYPPVTSSLHSPYKIYAKGG